MTIIKTIKEIVIQKYLENITLKKSERSNEIKFELNEEDKLAKCTKAKFKYLEEENSEIIVYKFDKNEKITKIHDKLPFFNDLSKLRSMCDFIILYSKNDKDILYVFLCNLKSDNKGNSNDQLNSGEIFSDFIINTAKRYSNDDNIKNIKIKYQKIVFSSKLLSKGTTKFDKTSKKGKRNYVSKENESQICDLDIICNEIKGK
ncbi:MAG: hypothetical protein AABZ74_03245 [Cyanobacteriota bacterium]